MKAVEGSGYVASSANSYREHSMAPATAKSSRILSSDELRQAKFRRAEFPKLKRNPITVVLDRVRQNYNIGAIFRLCDAFMVERLIIGGTTVELHKRKLVQAARGTQHWVPWVSADSPLVAVAAAKASGSWIAVVEQTNSGIPPEHLPPTFPICLVLGSEADGVSQEIIDIADATVTIPMLGMANSINVASAAAIMLYQLSAKLHHADGAV